MSSSGGMGPGWVLKSSSKLPKIGPKAVSYPNRGSMGRWKGDNKPLAAEAEKEEEGSANGVMMSLENMSAAMTEDHEPQKRLGSSFAD